MESLTQHALQRVQNLGTVKGFRAPEINVETLSSTETPNKQAFRCSVTLTLDRQAVTWPAVIATSLFFTGVASVAGTLFPLNPHCMHVQLRWHPG